VVRRENRNVVARMKPPCPGGRAYSAGPAAVMKFRDIRS
jgi:hypothetical protein